MKEQIRFGVANELRRFARHLAVGNPDTGNSRHACCSSDVPGRAIRRSGPGKAALEGA
jgi:hypothetical protein